MRKGLVKRQHADGIHARIQQEPDTPLGGEQAVSMRPPLEDERGQRVKGDGERDDAPQPRLVMTGAHKLPVPPMDAIEAPYARADWCLRPDFRPPAPIERIEAMVMP